MATASFTAGGGKATSPAKLNAKIFGLEVNNHSLLKDAYTAYLANGRTNLAKTKTRGLVSGGGRKPWKQKGTGRARFGSTRNPIWRSGGVAFGPTGEENYSLSLNVKAKRLAVRQALSLSAADSKIIVLDDFKLKNPKVSDANKLLAKIAAKGNILIVVSELNDDLKRATNNLADAKLIAYNRLNVVDILNADSLVMTKDALSAIDKWLGDK